MAIDAPETMWVQKKEAVKVSLGKADMATVVAALGKVRHKPIVKEIKVDTLMRVELSGDAFEIEWPEHVDKALREDEPAVWEFRVTPLRRGLQTLTIRGVVRVRIPKGDEQEFYELPVVEHKIDVRVNPARFIKQVAKCSVTTAVALWCIAIPVVKYVFELEAVRSFIGAYIKPIMERLPR
jgi:hypothetical protein